MKIEKRKVNNGIMQITTIDERWYEDTVNNPDTYVPSASWITSYYPKGIQYYKWLAEKGWDESEAIKNEAGVKGSRVHNAIEDLVKGNEVSLESKYFNELTGKDEELTAEEYYAVMTFEQWFNEFAPDEIYISELSGVNSEIGYGGTIDLVCKKGEDIWVIDYKTSQSIWKSYELQLSSYKYLLPFIHQTADVNLDNVKLAILQVGYNRTKKGYKFTEIDDQMDLFINAKSFWAVENKDKQPKQMEYPLEIKLNLK